ncbi:filamentous hemagglutinin family N-terminal domain protein [Rivularia sp. PCC 7116]|uniref:two-partner secretion domain-containing protein n=1 Tax=Rivularia sp. PCC 7116 TaxID=373994 RepID=UPI00029EF302|nr:filamentous hemagglutinin N-terminal domain-containing protein [Rivularia sp. PCC 7116]AFY55263.1 filamentous hemagglutinin family N-terminal domain protein [Rivularia sp. PCC 7116]
MYSYSHCLLWGFSVALSLAPVIEAKAQLIPDNTLGKENSLVTPTKLLQRIDGGAIRGSNLFHSFKEFNIENGKSVYFSNPNAIQNILTRVTGKNASAIFGKLGVLGNANLFLINPNGIIFGENASLDISGSFSATTSSSILFDNGFEFSTTNLQAPPLLKVNITPGLQYPRSQQGDISSKANLTVGKDLNLIGKNLNLTGKLKAGRDLNLKAENNLQIRDSSEIPFVADASNNLLLQGAENVDIFALNHPDSGLFSGNDLILKSFNPVLGDARYFSGGNFRVEQLDGSLGNLQSPNDPIIRASGDVSFESYNGASLHILAGGSVNITGDVTIAGTDDENGLQEEVILSNGEELDIDGKNQATLDIRAGINVTDDVTEIISENGEFIPIIPNTERVKSSSDIVLEGNIKVDSPDGLVFLTNQYNENANLGDGNIQIQGNIETSSNSGNAGTIIVDASGNIEISSNIKADSLTAAGGNISLMSGATISMIGADIDSQSNIDDVSTNPIEGGDIKLIAPAIILEDASRVTVGITGLGTGGNLIVETDDIKIFDGSGLSSITNGIGDSGDINITTKRLIIDNSLPEINSISIDNINNYRTGISTFVSRLPKDNSFNSDFFNSGEGGNINVNASEFIKLTGNKSGTFSPTLRSESLASATLDTGIISGTNGSGAAGNTNINTGQLIITNGAGIATSSISPASLTTIYPDLLSSLIDETIPNPQADAIIQTISDKLSKIPDAGDSGELTVNANKIELIGSSGLTAATFSSGNAGNLIINNTDQFILKDGAIVSTSTFSSGNAGDLQVTTDKLNVSNGSFIGAGTLKEGEGGKVSITAFDSVQIIGTSNEDNENQVSSKITTTSETGATGNAGELIVDTKKLIIADGAEISASTESTLGGEIFLQGLESLVLSNGKISASSLDGEAGDIIINALDFVNILENSKIASEATGTGIAGFIEINTKNLNIADASVASVNSKQSAGYILVNADNVTINNLSRVTAETESGISGDIEFKNLQTLQLSGESLVSATTIDGEAGDITINATDEVKIAQSSKIASGAIGKGEAGFLEIVTNNLNISDNSDAVVSSAEEGDAGLISIKASNVNLTNKATISANTASGDGGDIELNNLKTLFLSQESFINATTQDGTAGNIKINATDLVTVENNSKLASEAVGDGIAGNIDIVTNQLNLTDNSQANVSSQGNGSAGSLLVKANNVFLRNTAEIAAKTNESGTDGHISLDILNNLELSNSLISASTINGEAGDIDINATNSVKLSDSSMIASEAKGTGVAGELRITTNQFTMTNSQANVSSRNNGVAGDILINANNLNLFQDAKISATTESGEGGNITLNMMNNLSVNSSQITASTIDGIGGDLIINATESINLTGKGGLLVQASNGGEAGFIEANTNQFDVLDNSEINVSSKLGQAGYLEIIANNLFLSEGKLTAETGVGEGLESGNITLNIQDLLWMQNDSLISAEAFDIANGGNITINNPQGFVIGLTFENSDIIANANQGNGGNIDITTQNIFGLGFRAQRTLKSDITASSKFGVNGEVTVNQLDENSAHQLINLPSTLVQNAKIKAGCAASAGNNFIIRGKGGLPQSPNDLFDGNTMLVELADLVVAAESASNISVENVNSTNIDNRENQIIEATGWVKDADGNLLFIAKGTSEDSAIYSASCQDFSATSK